MAKIDVKTTDGGSAGSIDLDDAVWAVDVNEHLLWEAVKWQRAKRRSGTHSTKTVAEVSGGGKKPYRQKGTGNARQGSTRAPNHVGGGKVFGPHPRDYEYELPKKVRKGALRSALSVRVKEQKVIVLDKFALGDAKAKVTQQVAKILAKLGVNKALIVDGKDNETLARGTRNLPKAKFIAPEGINVYDVLNHETLIITKDSAKKVEEALKP
jgi:large subunit ribosomal protein L4